LRPRPSDSRNDGADTRKVPQLEIGKLRTRLPLEKADPLRIGVDVNERETIPGLSREVLSQHTLIRLPLRRRKELLRDPAPAQLLGNSPVQRQRGELDRDPVKLSIYEANRLPNLAPFVTMVLIGRDNERSSDPEDACGQSDERLAFEKSSDSVILPTGRC
jgi:hypothetical protein